MVDRPPFQIVRDRDLDSLVEYAAESVRLMGWTPTPFTLLHMATATLVGAIMGREWSFELFRKTPAFLRVPHDQGERDISWFTRLWRLGDTLYAVHRLDHISDRLVRMRGPDLESTLAELSVVERLRHAGPTWLRPESGGGYDADVMLDDRSMAAVEVKCRLEESEMTRSGIVNRLKQARKQLPRDRPTLIWLRYPGAILSRDQQTVHAKRLAVLDDAAREFLRNTSSVGALVFSAERPVLHFFPPEEQHALMVALAISIFPNHAAHRPKAFQRLLARLGKFTATDGVLVAPVTRKCKSLGVTESTPWHVDPDAPLAPKRLEEIIARDLPKPPKR